MLVNPGNWDAHRSLGHMIALPIMAMGALSLIGWMPVLLLVSLGLFGLYTMQYIFLYQMSQWGVPALSALHPVNALVILLTALYAGRASWRLATGPGKEHARGQRIGLALVAAVFAAAVGASALNPGDAFEEGDRDAGVPSLAEATETNLPGSFRAAKNPFSPADAGAVAAGQKIAQQRCIACHAADCKGQQLGATRSADLSQASVKRTEQFLMWAITSGSQRGMPGWGALPEEQRWQLVTFIKSLKP